jgi:predicted LPLAT superfamily acyltransferase
MQLFEQNNLEPIVLKPDGSHIFEINNALVNGGIVSTPADRTMGNTKTFEVAFLGNPALFPAGIFHVAAATEVPILTMFVVKESYRHYKIYIEKLAQQTKETKTEKALFLCNEFIKSLEKTCRQYPEQWYNYYPFWNEQKNVKN